MYHPSTWLQRCSHPHPHPRHLALRDRIPSLPVFVEKQKIFVSLACLTSRRLHPLMRYQATSRGLARESLRLPPTDVRLRHRARGKGSRSAPRLRRPCPRNLGLPPVVHNALPPPWLTSSPQTITEAAARLEPLPVASGTDRAGVGAASTDAQGPRCGGAVGPRPMAWATLTGVARWCRWPQPLVKEC